MSHNDNSRFLSKKPVISSIIPKGSSKRVASNRDGVLEFSEKSSEICAILELCQTCTLLHSPYPLQLVQKTKHFKALVSQASPALAKAQILDCIDSSQTLAYRHSAKLVVSQTLKKGVSWIQIGLYKPGTHDVIDITGCPVQAKVLNDIFGYIRRMFQPAGLTAYNPKTKVGLVRYVVIRSSSDERYQFVTFVTSTAHKSELQVFTRQMMEQFPTIVGVVQHINTTSGNEIFQSQGGAEQEHFGQENTVLLAGQDYFKDRLGGNQLKISATSFFQINPKVADKIYNRVVEILPTSLNQSALDLYCGVGGISLNLAERFGQVIGIEETASSIRDAMDNAAFNGKRNVEFVQGKVEDVLGKVLARTNTKPLGAVVLNPSRRGCQPQVLEQIAQAGAPLLVYVSCFPETLLRDLELLSKHGYNAVFFELFDMFPGTTHYEVLAFLQKKS